MINLRRAYTETIEPSRTADVQHTHATRYPCSDACPLSPKVTVTLAAALSVYAVQGMDDLLQRVQQLELLQQLELRNALKAGVKAVQECLEDNGGANAVAGDTDACKALAGEGLARIARLALRLE